jgi:hypothetical protein
MPLEGKWFNELGSEMNLHIKDGLVTGTYHTAVGNETKTRPLAGRADVTNDTSPNIGFAVSWGDKDYAESVTAWSGQLQIINGQEILTTFWLLTAETTPDNNWRSTLIGQDIFKRTSRRRQKLMLN